MMPTVIMPVDLSRRGAEIIDRFSLWGEAADRAQARLIVGLAHRGSADDDRIRAVAAVRRNVEVVDAPAGAGVNLAVLRNVASKYFRTGTLLFADVDIYPNLDLFHALSRQVEEGAALAMAPCIYLSKRGTQALLAGRSTISFLEDFRTFNTQHVLHVAMPSSVMAVRAEDHHAIGGFYEGYFGHGYEDFDYMLRLIIEKNLVIKSADLLMDRPYRAPLLAEGFRAALGTLCLPNMLEEKVALHMFHHRDNNEDYYLLREKNSQLFQKRFADSVGRSVGESHIIPPMILDFYAECAKREIDPAKWHALFDARPRHMLQRRPVLSRAWRVLRGRLRVNFGASKESPNHLG